MCITMSRAELPRSNAERKFTIEELKNIFPSLWDRGELFILGSHHVVNVCFSCLSSVQGNTLEILPSCAHTQ